MPDTNILVDNLGNIRTLAEYGDFSLKVPTTVLVELEGLAKDTARQEVTTGAPVRAGCLTCWLSGP